MTNLFLERKALYSAKLLSIIMELKIKYRDVAYRERGEERKRFIMQNQAKLSVVICPGPEDSEIETLWAFIEEAIQGNITVLCRDDGYYILSRNVNGSKPNTTYECIPKNRRETEILINLIEKHFKRWLKK